jgi:DNA primase
MEFARQLKSSIDIVQVIGEYVRLKKTGNTHKGLCPFHTEKSPSFNVRPTHQHFKCFGCGIGGDAIKFVMEIEGLSFWEACKQLAERYGIPLPKRMDQADADSRKRAGLYEAHEIAQRIYREALASPAGSQAREYLAHRGVTPKVAEEFGLGLSPRGGQVVTAALQKAGLTPRQLDASGLSLARNDGSGYFDRFRGRLMFPIHNESGQLIAYGGRALNDDDQPKYLNSSETEIYRKSKVLYNLHRARKPVRAEGRIVLVEGYMDVIGLSAAGVAEVVASCGTALTPDQVRIMRRHSENITVNFDPDAAGVNAAERSVEILLEEEMHIRILSLPGDLDPDEFIRAHGLDHYRKLLTAAPRYFEWLSDRARERFDMKSAEGRVAAFKFLLPAIQRLPDRIERAAVVNDVASQLGVEKGMLLDQFRRMAADRVKEPLRVPAVEIPPNEKLLLRCLLESAEARQAVLSRLSEMEFAQPLVSARILEAMVAVGEPFVYGELEARLEDTERSLLSAVAFADEGSESFSEANLSPAQALDCLRVLDGAIAEAQRSSLKMRIAAAERGGNLEEALRLSADLELVSGGSRRRRRAELLE